MIDFEKAFNSLSTMVDNSVNHHSLSQESRDENHRLAYLYKQAIRGQYGYSSHPLDEIKNFEREAVEHCKKYKVYRPWA